jgi:hypothetical protein
MTASHTWPEHHVVHEDEAVRETPAPGPGTADDQDVLILEPDQYTAEDAPEPAAETVPDPVGGSAAETVPDPVGGSAAEAVPDPVGGPMDAISEPATAQPTSTIFEPATAEPTSTIFEPATAEPTSTTAEPDTIAEPPGALVEPPGTPPDDAFAADIPPTNPDYRWREIQAMFVDDPRGSVERAADLARDALRDLNNMLRERERDLRSAWQDTNADTEELRTSLQGYRALVNRISEIAQQR